MKKIFLVILAACCFTSCRKEGSPPPPPPDPPLTAATELNVAYGNHASQKMDVYLPQGRTTAATKVLIMIHGGGWTQGDKADFNAYVDTLKRRLPGYAIFNINYRLATGSAHFFPTQEEDVKSAIEFIYAKRDEYKISGKFVLLGASAGGHLSLLHAYKYSTPVPIQAVVDFFGPTELVSLYNNPPNPLIPLLLIQVTGGIPTTHLTLYQQSGPLNFVNAQSPPTIILQGGADIVVPPFQSTLLRDKLQTFGVAHQFVYYATENHGWSGANLVDSFDKIQAFLAAHVP